LRDEKSHEKKRNGGRLSIERAVVTLRSSARIPFADPLSTEVFSFQRARGEVEKEVKIERRDVMVMAVGNCVGRVSYILYICFLAFLLLTVAGREIPEMSRLTDDASNDGQVVGLIEPLPSPESRRVNADGTIETGNSSVHPFALQNFAPRDLGSRDFRTQFLGSRDHPLLVSFAMTGPDLLRFLAIRRT
jgi:hypothetical protein